MEKWFKIENGVKKARIYIYGNIGGWEEKNRKSVKTAESFIEAFDKISANEIDIHINSGGGNVFEGIAIYSHIVSSGKTVHTYIDALAASIASIIALAGEKVFMARNAQFMIHNATAVVMGTAADMRKTAGILESIEEQLIDIYHQKTNIDKKELREMMDAETWMNSQTAKEKGFADEITAALKIAASADLSQFKHPPAELKKYIDTNQGGYKMEELLKLLQVSDETAAIAAIKGIMREKDSLKDENDQLKQKLSQFEEKEIENAVNKAIEDGKILPAQKDWALNLAKTDKKMFSEFLKTSKPVNLNEEPIATGAEKKVTFEDLLDDPKLFAEWKEKYPQEFAKLQKEYYGGE